MPGPLPLPIGHERATRGISSRDQRSASANALELASVQTTPDVPDSEGLVDSGVQLPSSTNDEDDVQDLRDSFDLLPLVQQRELYEIYLPPMSDAQLEQFWRPVGNGPTVPVEMNRRLFDLGNHYPGQLFDPYYCAALRRALATSDPFAYHPMGPPPWVVRKRLEKEPRTLGEHRLRQEERLREEQRRRQEEEDQRREKHLERLRTEELSRKRREEDDLQRITDEHAQIMQRPDLLIERYNRPETKEERKNCVRQHTQMLLRRTRHLCTDAPCFDDACTIDLAGLAGCRYAEALHAESNMNPCMWGWGLMLKNCEDRLGSAVAKTTDLDEIAAWYRRRRRTGQRFQGPVLARDPPNAPDGTNYYIVKAPLERNEQSRE